AAAPSVITGAETWLDSYDLDCALKIDGYSTLFRRDRNNHGGGCIVYVAEGLEAEDPIFEVLFFKIMVAPHKCYVIATCYRPDYHSITDFLQFLDLSSSNIKLKYRNLAGILLVGDFNAHCSTWCPTKLSTTEGKHMFDFVVQSNMHQLVNEVTRTVSKTCLDLVVCDSLIKGALGKNKTASIPTLRTDQGEQIKDLAEKAEVLNQYFAQTCTMPKSLCDKQLPAFPIRTTKQLTKCVVSENDVFKILSRLNISKAGAPGLNNRVLRELAPVIASPFAQLINGSFASGVFPACWKLGFTNALYKTGHAHLKTNYRPIILLPALSK
ncbi:unnamed protein product, partial [Didymodactylos carnosus]